MEGDMKPRDLEPGKSASIPNPSLVAPENLTDGFALFKVLRGAILGFGGSIVKGLRIIEDSAQEAADALQKSENAAAVRALSYGARGIQMLFKGMRYGGEQLVDMLFSPNALMLWTLISAVMMIFSPFGYIVGAICCGVTVATVLGNILFKGYQLYNIELARHEQRQLVTLTDLNHELQLRLQILKIAGVEAPGLLSQLTASSNPKKNEHVTAKAIARGFIYAAPDMAMSIVGTVLSGNPLAYVVGAISIAGGATAQMHAANETEKKKVELLNDIAERKAILGLDYKGHNRAMAEAQQAKHELYEQLSKQIGKLEIEKAGYIVEMTKKLNVAKNLNTPEKVATRQELAQTMENIENTQLPDFSKPKDVVQGLQTLQKLEQERQAKLKELGFGKIIECVRSFRSKDERLMEETRTQIVTSGKLLLSEELVNKFEGLATKTRAEQADLYIEFSRARGEFENMQKEDEHILQEFDKIVQVANIKPMKEVAHPKYNVLSIPGKILLYFQSIAENFAHGMSSKSSKILNDPLIQPGRNEEGGYGTEVQTYKEVQAQHEVLMNQMKDLIPPHPWPPTNYAKNVEQEREKKVQKREIP